MKVKTMETACRFPNKWREEMLNYCVVLIDQDGVWFWGVYLFFLLFSTLLKSSFSWC